MREIIRLILIFIITTILNSLIYFNDLYLPIVYYNPYLWIGILANMLSFGSFILIIMKITNN